MINIKEIKEKNYRLLRDATKYRIVVFKTKYYDCYLLEAYDPNYINGVDICGEWKPVRGTVVPFMDEKQNYFRDYENAYNRCKKIAKKIEGISINDLIKESCIASLKYGYTGYTPKYTIIW